MDEINMTSQYLSRLFWLTQAYTPDSTQTFLVFSSPLQPAVCARVTHKLVTSSAQIFWSQSLGMALDRKVEIY